jgi:two-component system sensor kinase FixL
LNGRHRSGRDLPLEVSFGFLRRSKGKTLFTGIVRDISDRLQTEMELEKKRQELAHVTRVTTMGEMATGLAHEVNQPLAAIAAYARGASVRLKAGKANLEELTTVVERIAEDAHRAGEVIRRLRQFVKRRDTERTAVDANHIVREVCAFVVAEAAHRQVTLTTDLAANLPRVKADSVEIQQVLLNLVRNAFDAVATMNTSQRRVCVGTRLNTDDDAEVSVADAGPGISANLKEQVFEPFFTSKEAGLGMGLAICRTLVESHGGRIWTRESHLGGARVCFSLPLAREDSAHGN